MTNIEQAKKLLKKAIEINKQKTSREVKTLALIQSALLELEG